MRNEQCGDTVKERASKRVSICVLADDLRVRKCVGDDVCLTALTLAESVMLSQNGEGNSKRPTRI